MSFDLSALERAVTRHGRVLRVVIAEVRGSSPREVGAAMLLWQEASGAEGQSGTIGGGALEHRAAQAAREGARGLSRHALGPDMGQCCGGSVALLTEEYDAGALAALAGAAVIARPVRAGSGVDVDAEAEAEAEAMPLALRRLVNAARARGEAPAAQMRDGWMIEPLAHPQRQLWIWGAGHVGRALVDVLSPLPELALTWVDTAPARFPDTVPKGVSILPAPNPAPLAARAGAGAEHLVLTYSHALDLEICHQLLTHGFAFAGLIGSKTKWARFRSRLAALGHSPEAIARITCPIGEPALGKHPQAIALGVAAQLLRRETAQPIQKDRSA